MSHVVKVVTQVRDAVAVSAGCNRLGLEAPVEGEVKLFRRSFGAIHLLSRTCRRPHREGAGIAATVISGRPALPAGVAELLTALGYTAAANAAANASRDQAFTDLAQDAEALGQSDESGEAQASAAGLASAYAGDSAPAAVDTPNLDAIVNESALHLDQPSELQHEILSRRLPQTPKIDRYHHEGVLEWVGRAWGALTGSFSGYGSNVAQTLGGYFWQGPKEMIGSLLDMGLHPIKTMQALIQLAEQLRTDPGELWAAIMEEVKSKANGSPADQGALAFEIITSLATGGSGNFTKGGKLAKLLDKLPNRSRMPDLPDAPKGPELPVVQEWCFAPDTLVQTPQGKRPIADIREGESVLAFDFNNGKWVTRIVQACHRSHYRGAVIAVTTEQATVVSTAYHPFWVKEGHDLLNRPRPIKLAKNEDEALSVRGRWVNSHDLFAGDLLLAEDGRELRVLGITQRYEEFFAVCNLTIHTNHSFAVGNDGILVHNTGCGHYGTKAPDGLADELTDIQRKLKEGKKTLTPEEKASLRDRRRQLEEMGETRPDRFKHTLDFIQDAWIEFEKHGEFRNWAHKKYKNEMGFGDGTQHNPDISKSMIADAFQEWLDLGKPKL